MTYVDPNQTKLNYKALYESDPASTRTLIKRALNDGWVEVRFKKVKTNEERLMLCTTSAGLIESLIGPPVKDDHKPELIKKVRKESDDVCRVFDGNKKEWRSFRYDHLLDVNMNLNFKIFKVVHLTDDMNVNVQEK